MTRAADTGARAAKSKAIPPAADPDDGAIALGGKAAGYFYESEKPLTSLLFVLPMIVVYEFGTRWYATDPVNHTEQRVIAFNLMRQFFDLLGAHGKYLPCFAIVAVLLTIHLLKRDTWVVRPSTLLGMGVESAFLAVPLLLAGQMVIHYLQQITLVGMGSHDREMIVTFLGAGIYEELVFRLAGFAVLSLLFRDLLKIEKKLSMLLIVVSSGILFSLYHYLGNEPFSWPSFIFRTVAGIYFGLLLMFRGFGVTAGSHTAYDIIVWAMR